MKPPAPHRVRDRSIAHAGRAQLLAREDSILRIGQLRKVVIASGGSSG